MDKSEPSSDPESQNHDSSSTTELERIRQKLLDTSSRNSLINCSLDSAQAVRLVDEFPDQVYASLLKGKRFELAPVPAPTQQELLEEASIEYSTDADEGIENAPLEAKLWAHRYGINTDLDLLDGQSHDDRPNNRKNALQTLQFPDDLNTQLANIRHLATTAIEETGTNTLYLALGFLEWYESRSSDRRRLAPLFLAPITLSRDYAVSGDDPCKYQIELRDDGLMNNATLSQRMLNDFALELPKVSDETVPEQYLRSIGKLASSQKDSRWKVRRYATICLLDFTRQLLYEDLDPARWPAKKSLAEHPLVHRFLTLGDNSQQHATTTTTEHIIDDIENIHSTYPLVFDADSSQYSALIDAVNGQNLVIEGPPGTGKSQTIANVIAACINQRLSVLFVAEKLTALEVVKRRLDLAELGDFCLDIHAHNSSKESVLKSLESSHMRRNTAVIPNELQHQISRYEQLKNLLRRHKDKLNTPWQTSGLTPHQILQRASELRQRSPLDINSRMSGIEDPSLITADFIAKTLTAVKRLQADFLRVQEQTPDAAISTHPWFGAGNGNMQANQRHTLFSALEQWTEKQSDIMAVWMKLQIELQIDSVDTPNQERLTDLMETLDNLPRDIPEALLRRIDELRSSKTDLETIAQKRFDFREQFSELANHINADDITSHKRAIHTTSGLLKLNDELGLTGSAPLKKVRAHCEQLDALQARVEALNAKIAELQGNLPEAFDDICSKSINGARALIELLDIVDQLPPTLWRHRHERYANQDFAEALDEVQPIILSLRQHRAMLSGIFDITHLPDSQTIDELVQTLRDNGVSRLLNKEYREAKESLSQLLRTGIKPAEGVEALPVLLQYLRDLEAMHADYAQHPALGSAFAALDTDLKLHRKLLSWYQAVNEQFGQHSLKAAALLSLDDQTATLLTDAAESELRTRANSIVKSLAKLHSLYPTFFDQSSDDTAILDPALGLAALKHHIDDCIELIGDSMLDSSRSLSELLDVANRWLNCINDHSQWTQEENYIRYIPSLFAIDTDPNVDDSYAVSTLSTAQYLAGLASTSNLFLEAMLQEPTSLQLGRLHEAQPALIEHLDAAAMEQQRFEAIGHIDPQKWLNNCQTMTQCVERNNHALQEVDSLATWLSYERTKRKAESVKLYRLIEHLENGTLAAEQASLAAEADLYQQLAAHLMNVDTELAELNNSDLHAVREQFQDCKQQLQQLQSLQIAANCTETGIPSGNDQGAHDTFTEFALIRHEAGKDSQHAPIRSILKRAPITIKALKPCFMMSPTSVAQYLEPGQYEFDVLIVDEASQIHTEALLGAIARAKQLVVVGDPRQLPPAALLTEDTKPETIEGILHSAIDFLPKRRLQWHYRSQHESLMSFSNENFYQSNIDVFPSPFEQCDDSGIKFTRLTQAAHEDGVNLHEVEKTLGLLIQHVMHRPSESIGVIAMNTRQRSQIEAQLEQRHSSNELLQRALERNLQSAEPLFIKSLENVQGDERDVIIISMTYGPEISDGMVEQNFSPIDSDIGWRGLNVLLTRARKRMQIVASIGSDDVIVDESSSRGVQCLHTFLRQCESGRLINSKQSGQRQPTSFQRAVINMLSKAGFSAEFNAGVTGVFVEIAVRNPDNPNEFLMGIECDGANHDPANSVHDSELLRQEILKKMGWIIRRISSTDWYRDADAQLQPIFSELEQIRTERKNAGLAQHAHS